MKNKKMVYILGLAVAIVWGLIIYRIVDAAGGGGDDAAPVAVSNLPKEPYNDFSVQKDTERLLLNYRDPFGLVKQKDTADLRTKRNFIKTAAATPAKPAFNWGFIQYAGYIRNPGSNKIITIISINGKNEMLAEGETKSQVKLIKNLGDSVQISFNGKTKFILIKPSI